MPAKNVYHDTVIQALVADGWTITDDPLKVEYGDRNLYVDLGAERSTLGAEKSGRKIAVEIQSFLGLSPVRDLEEAVGQYQVYLSVLAVTEPDRQLYLAAPLRTYETLLTEKLGLLVISRLGLRLLIFDDKNVRVHQWIEFDRYRQIVRRVIEQYAEWRPSHGQIASEAIVDPEKDHYEVEHVGWDGDRRIHGSVIHLDIIDGKIWIQHDGTNRPVAEELLAAGVPREDIVLGFHPARVRHLTGFAVD